MATVESTWGRKPPGLLTSTLIPISFALILHPLLPILLPDDVISKLAIPPQPTFPALQANCGFALLAFIGAVHAVPSVSHAFVEKGLKGRDLCKSGGRTSGPWV